ncbi:MAG: DUF4410 domain-containing protein [Nitrosomonas sp.]|nr:MAG: DUF4410 domain-containing protein [Nitrosomonas sp.]
MKIISTNVLLLLITLISGCASTGGSYKPIGSPLTNERGAKFSELLINVQSGSDVSLNQESIDRMTKQIIENIKADTSNRFSKINGESPSTTTLEASIIITKYEEGNAFARAMLAGLGQMHIDADVTLYDHASKDKLTQYEVNKTFAWGGVYGGITTIKDVEIGFSKAIADSILGKE